MVLLLHTTFMSHWTQLVPMIQYYLYYQVKQFIFILNFRFQGINNTSQSDYIRNFVKHSIDRQYRVAVLNHTGALRDVELSGRRIFTYGNYSTVYITFYFLIRGCW